MARTQITLRPKIQARVRECAGINPARVFNLGKSHGPEIAKNKDAMIAEAFASLGTGKRHR